MKQDLSPYLAQKCQTTQCPSMPIQAYAHFGKNWNGNGHMGLPSNYCPHPNSDLNPIFGITTATVSANSSFRSLILI